MHTHTLHLSHAILEMAGIWINLESWKRRGNGNLRANQIYSVKRPASEKGSVPQTLEDLIGSHF